MKRECEIVPVRFPGGDDLPSLAGNCHAHIGSAVGAWQISLLLVENQIQHRSIFQLDFKIFAGLIHGEFADLHGAIVI